jgi:DNA-binding transcriptional regulator YhcF (GntR family)
VEVNPNTVVRSYTYLQDKGIIYNKRGIGYFVSGNAVLLINDYRKDEFIKSELPEMFKVIDVLNIPFEEIKKLYENHKKNSGLK